MPTGYTAGVADGKVTDFRTFALQCARQFGACIMQRDEATSVLPRHREPSVLYEKMLRDAQARLAFLNTLTVAQAQGEADREYFAAKDRHDEYDAGKREQKARYEAQSCAKWRTE